MLRGQPSPASLANDKHQTTFCKNNLDLPVQDFANVPETYPFIYLIVHSRSALQVIHLFAAVAVSLLQLTQWRVVLASSAS